MLVLGHIWYGIGTEIGVALGIYVVAREKALQLQDDHNKNVLPGEKRRTDKWTHAYVRCALRRGNISSGVARMMAEGKEILDAIEDFFTGDADSTPEDSAATMNGYWNAYEGAQIKKKNRV